MKSRKPMNQDFEKLVDYRTYRIRFIHALSLQKKTKLANKTLKFFQTKNVQTFTGKQPLYVFEFLASFVITEERVHIGEMEAMDILPDFLDGTEKSSVRTEQRIVSARRNEFIWPRTVLYLLRSYITDGNLDAGEQNLYAIKLKVSEFKHELIERIQQAHSNLGAFLKEPQLTAVFLQDLVRPIHHRLVSFLRENRKKSLHTLIEKASDIGDELRSSSTKKGKDGRVLLIMDQAEDDEVLG